MSRNANILEGLFRAEEEGRLPHALILSGPASDAKVLCVEKFAARLFAKSGGGLFGAGGDEGHALQRIQARNHPDFTRVEPSEGRSSLEAVRELPRLVAFQPLEASRRVVLLPDATELNAQAYNAFLKILEEPPVHTMFFLLCRDPGELAQTIVSRCQVLRFAPLADEELRELLGDAGRTELQTVLAWAEGSLERARLLAGEEEGLALRREACERLLELWESSPRIPSAAASFVEAVEGDAQAAIVLDSWETLLRDLVFAAAGAGPDAIRFRDLHSRLAALGVKGGEAALAEIPKKASAINRFRVWRELNGNLRLDFAALLAELQIFSVGNARTTA
jgi:DNA polymerase-3 subunit delta'